MGVIQIQMVLYSTEVCTCRRLQVGDCTCDVTSLKIAKEMEDLYSLG